MIGNYTRGGRALEIAVRNAGLDHGKKIISLSIIVIFVLFSAGCVEKPLNFNNITYTSIPTPVSDNAIKEKIRSNLIGTSIVYYDIAGRPVAYNVTEKDIKSIEKTVLEGRIVWKVRIGEKLAWDYYYEEQGNEIIKKEQLFVT